MAYHLFLIVSWDPHDNKRRSNPNYNFYTDDNFTFYKNSLTKPKKFGRHRYLKNLWYRVSYRFLCTFDAIIDVWFMEPRLSPSFLDFRLWHLRSPPLFWWCLFIFEDHIHILKPIHIIPNNKILTCEECFLYQIFPWFFMKGLLFWWCWYCRYISDFPRLCAWANGGMNISHPY